MGHSLFPIYIRCQTAVFSSFSLYIFIENLLSSKPYTIYVELQPSQARGNLRWFGKKSKKFLVSQKQEFRITSGGCLYLEIKARLIFLEHYY